jgi:hypothetical protein
MLYRNHNLHIRLISRYIDERLRPRVEQITGDEAALGWEGWYTANSARMFRIWIPHFAALVVLFPIPALVALVLALPALSKWWSWVAWGMGIALLLAQVALPRMSTRLRTAMT